MKEENETLHQARQRVQQLQHNSRSLMLATIGEQSLPRASYAPYVRDEAGNYYIYVSRLAEHTQELISNPVASVLLIEDESATKQIFARVRISHL